MIGSRSVTRCADPGRDMPDGMAARLDHIRAARESLREEERRLRRIGLEIPLGRCREQRRYWDFMAALFSVADPEERERTRGGSAWRIDPIR